MEFKEKGNVALKAKDYAEAVKCYTQAIDSGDDTDSLHVFYGNRSAAHLHNGSKDSAIKDAKKCVSLKSDWAKGHARLGAAYFAKNQMSLAVQSYQKASNLDPSSDNYKASLADANKRDRINRGLEQPAGGGYSAGSYAQFPTTAPPSARGPQPKSIMEHFSDMRATLRAALNTVMLLAAIVYLAPTAMSYPAYRIFIFSAIGSNILLLSNHGTPSLTQAYGQKVITDPATHYLFFCMVFISGRPKFLALIPLLVYCIYGVCDWFSKLFALTSPGLNATGAGLIDKVVPGVLGIPEWSSLSADKKWTTAARKIPEFSASVEVAVGFLLIMELFLPTRNVLQFFMYWSGFLRLKYMVSPDCKKAFTQYDGKIMGYIGSVPFVNKAYAMIKSFLAAQVKMPTPEEARKPSMFSKCTIM